MNLCNTNRLRISVNSAQRYAVATGVTHYRSDDHGRGTEHNWSLCLGPVWVAVKFRPNGKHQLREGV